MTRIHVICEGQTEETFIKELLNPYFNSKRIYLFPSLIGTVGHKGGAVNAERLFRDIRNRLNDKTAYCTTFFDFYALPSDFPGKDNAHRQNNIMGKAQAIQAGLSQKLTEKLGSTPMQRFIPYVQMYEFEGLLFSDPLNFSKGINQENLAMQLQNIRDNFASPEEINDSPITTPSKRVSRLAPGYEKPLYGSLAALEIGLNTILSECALFRGWIEKLESLRPSTN